MITSDSPNDEVLTVPEVARILRTRDQSAYLLVASGQIRSVRVGPQGRGIRIPRAALDEFLAGQPASSAEPVSSQVLSQ